MPEELATLEEPTLADAPAAAGTSGTVLAVDDDPRNIELVTHILETQGYRVIAAEDGETALALAHSAAPDVILLDVLMPHLNGYETCRRLKADPTTLYIPILIVTALRGSRERVRGIEAGADEFVSKPYDSLELLTRVRALARTKRLYDQLRAANRDLEERVAERTADLQHALAELRELDRLRAEFIANVSHELRTPLLHVKGTITLLADGALGNLNEQQTHGVKVAEEAAEQLERVVEDVVDFSDVHGRPLEMEPVLVSEVCQSAINALQARAARRNITLRLSVPPELPPVRADAQALTRVLRHLLDNAVKFSPAESLVQVLAERRGVQIRLAVQDEGPGIPEAERERIFHEFYQSDGSSTRKAGGMGLGLALVQQLLHAHDSEIHLETEEGRGSTFFFELPVSH